MLKIYERTPYLRITRGRSLMKKKLLYPPFNTLSLYWPICAGFHEKSGRLNLCAALNDWVLLNFKTFGPPWADNGSEKTPSKNYSVFFFTKKINCHYTPVSLQYTRLSAPKPCDIIILYGYALVLWGDVPDGVYTMEKLWTHWQTKRTPRGKGKNILLSRGQKSIITKTNMSRGS